MKEKLTRDDVIAALRQMADDLTASADELRQLDAAIGDGDLGITMGLGFGAVKETLTEVADADIGTILLKTGMAFNRKAASTFGALYASMMMRAAKEAKGLSELGVGEVARLVAAAAEGVQARGKASPGDKTMLDALLPASEALAAAAAAEGVTLPEAMERAASAAEQGMIATREMKSKIGRASWFADRTVGIQDPGATAVCFMFRSLNAFVHQAQ